MVNYFDFGRFHGKGSIQGSTFIRMVQMEKYWPDLSAYKYGANPDALIFQKVYVTPDYQFPANFKGIKILDVCDSDWLDEMMIVETCNAMDAVTCPTEELASFLKQFHDNVVIIPDRFDLKAIPKPKAHTAKAKTVVWFGYSHNAELLKPAMGLLDELDLNLILISNDDPFPHRFSSRQDYKKWYTFIKYNEKTIYEDLKKGDLVLLPDGFRPQDRFKSNNKTVKANLVGLPVAKTADDVKLYLDPEKRQGWLDSELSTIQSEYDICKSVEQYKELIKNIGELGK